MPTMFACFGSYSDIQIKKYISVFAPTAGGLSVLNATRIHGTMDESSSEIYTVDAFVNVQ